MVSNPLQQNNNILILSDAIRAIGTSIAQYRLYIKHFRRRSAPGSAILSNYVQPLYATVEPSKQERFRMRTEPEGVADGKISF
jgi:hypothetical protein